MGEAGDRGDVDDRAPALRFHVRDRRLHRKEGAGDVARERVVPVLERHLHQRRAGARAADIVVQDVDPPERVDAGRDHGGDFALVGHVRLMRDGGAAFAFDDIAGFPGRLQPTVDAEHRRALARIEHRRRLAVAPARPDGAGTGNQRDPAGDAPGIRGLRCHAAAASSGRSGESAS